MKKIWICPVCRSSSTRKANLKVHIKNFHPETNVLPVAFDPLLKEYAVPRPDEIIYYRESFPHPPFNMETKVDEVEPASVLRDRTRTLNKLSDYGDAVKRFKKHGPISIYPSVSEVLMASNPFSCARMTRGISYSSLGAMAASYAERDDGSNTSSFFGFNGNICKTCGEVTVIFVSEFPPEETASERHLVTLKQEKPLPSLTPSLPLLQDELFDRLSNFVRAAFAGKKYLYCKRLKVKENFWTVTINQESVEAKMGIPGKFNRVKMLGLRPDHWAIRAYKQGRTEISEVEVAQFLKNAQATYAIFWAQLDGLPEYYFMWIDEDKPYLRMESAEILRKLGI